MYYSVMVGVAKQFLKEVLKDICYNESGLHAQNTSYGFSG